MIIRPARAGDADAIVRLVNSAYEVEQFFVAGDRTSRAEIQRLVDEGTLLVAAEGEAVTGCVHVAVHGEAGYFGMLAVDRVRRSQGLGRRLIEAAEDRARSAGARAMDIHVVNLRTDLFPYYHQLGYGETGETRPYVHRPVLRPCHFVVMRKAL